MCIILHNSKKKKKGANVSALFCLHKQSIVVSDNLTFFLFFFWLGIMTIFCTLICGSCRF